MAYKVIVTEQADEMVDRHVSYLIFHLKNPDAASHFLVELEMIYDRLEANPFQYAESQDRYLRFRGYREALFQDMRYRVVFRADEHVVYILGVFNTLEDYGRKIN